MNELGMGLTDDHPSRASNDDPSISIAKKIGIEQHLEKNG